jgi:hypothetical protein
MYLPIQGVKYLHCQPHSLPVWLHVSQASLTCSIAPDATIKNMANLGGIEGKEVRL